MVEIKWHKAELNTERASYGNIDLKKVKVGNNYAYHIISDGETIYNTFDKFDFLRRLTGNTATERYVSDEVAKLILQGKVNH